MLWRATAKDKVVVLEEEQVWAVLETMMNLMALIQEMLMKVWMALCTRMGPLIRMIPRCPKKIVVASVFLASRHSMWAATTEAVIVTNLAHDLQIHILLLDHDLVRMQEDSIRPMLIVWALPVQQHQACRVV